MLWLGGEPQQAPAAEPGTAPIAPRRTVLDPILLSAAAHAGVQVEMGCRCSVRSRAGPGTGGWVDVTTTADVPGGPVPGVPGRVLDRDHVPVGTCFQVAPGVLVTRLAVLLDGVAEVTMRRAQLAAPPGRG